MFVLSRILKVLKVFLWFVFIIYCLVLVKYLVLDRLYYIGFTGRAYNFYPLKSISAYFIRREHYNLNILIENLLGNLIMLVPFGILMPMLFKRYRKTLNFFIFIFILNLSIETLQITIKLGIFDVDDIILNCTGAMIAYGFIRLIRSNPFINKLLKTIKQDFKQLNEETRIN